MSRLAVVVACAATLSCGRMGFDERGEGGTSACPTPPAGCMTVECGVRCYELCTTLRSWSTAQEDCGSRGACLARVDTADEGLCLAIAGAGASNNIVWLGLVQGAGTATPDASWSWACAIEPAQPLWLAGEPDDADGIEDGRQDCGFVRVPGGGLADAPCGDRHWYACEYVP